MYKLVKFSLSVILVPMFFSVYTLTAYTDWNDEHHHEHHYQQYGQPQEQQEYNYYQQQYRQPEAQQGYGNNQYNPNIQNNPINPNTTTTTTTRTIIYSNPGSIYSNPYANPYGYTYSYPYAATQIWVWAQNGAVPMNAVVNQNLNNTATYFCRVFTDNNMYSGVLVPNDGCYVQIGDQYVLFINYQVLASLGY